MDYDSIDRAASRYVIRCEQHGNHNPPMFLSTDGFATDIPERVWIFRDGAEAHLRAQREMLDTSWTRFGWRLEAVPFLGSDVQG